MVCDERIITGHRRRVAEPDLGNIEHRADDLTSMRGVKLYSLDQNTAGQLWMTSEELLGFRFDVG
jgi:hypothetical protein